MARDALAGVSTRTTPPTQQADTRQVRNHGGGYSFRVDGDALTHRFLTLGSEGGTYYVQAPKLTAEAAGHILARAKAGDMDLITQITEISASGRAPRVNPAIFALAIAQSHGTPESKAAALDALPLVCRTGSHLETWAGYIENFRGWGIALQRAVSRWYLNQDPQDLAYQALKYKSRGGWRHADLIKLSHPGSGKGGLPVTPEQHILFKYIRKLPMGDLPPSDHAAGHDLDAFPLIVAHDAAHATRDVDEWVRLVTATHGLAWEMLPSEALKYARVWEALFYSGNLPMGALVRNLPRLTNLGLLKPMGKMTGDVCKRLTDPEALVKARIHPMNQLVALRTYARGHGDEDNDTTWRPVPKVTDALDESFYASFGSVEPAGVPTVHAVDVSDSMTWNAAGKVLMAAEAAAAMALVTARTEPQAAIMGFSHRLVDLNISPRERLDDVMAKIRRMTMGSTDISLPMLWAMDEGLEDVGHFTIGTDGEVNTGRMHPHQALAQYRERHNPAARLSQMAFTSTWMTVAEPGDPGSLDVSGFDAAVPRLLADFGGGRV